jgi:hypothetical protein
MQDEMDAEALAAQAGAWQSDTDMEYTPVERWDVKMAVKDSGREIEELQQRVRAQSDLITMLSVAHERDALDFRVRITHLEKIVHRLMNGASPFWKNEEP